METWVAITLAAAFLQNLRSAMQKHLKSVMGTTGATFVRFGFGLPVAACFLAILHLVAGFPLPALNGVFFFWVVVGGIAQILATFLLVHLFSFRNFAVGTAYSRTEPAQAALFGMLFLSETLRVGVVVAIIISVIGVMLISVARMTIRPMTLVTSLFQRNTLIGLGSGSLFGIGAVAYRAASLSLGGPNFIMQAAMTLAVVILFQTIIMLAWMYWRERMEIARVLAAWKPSLIVGIAGASASFGWFMAMTLQPAAVIKVLGQVEIIFTFASSVFVFRERINWLEVFGCLLIVGGILVLVMV